jgi:ferrous iron transport protein A
MKMLTQGFTVCLSSLELLEPGEQGIVTRFSNADATLIMQLVEIGITPGSCITLEQRVPDFVVKIGNNRLELTKAVARVICVRVIL